MCRCLHPSVRSRSPRSRSVLLAPSVCFAPAVITRLPPPWTFCFSRVFDFALGHIALDCAYSVRPRPRRLVPSLVVPSLYTPPPTPVTSSVSPSLYPHLAIVVCLPIVPVLLTASRSIISSSLCYSVHHGIVLYTSPAHIDSSWISVYPIIHPSILHYIDTDRHASPFLGHRHSSPRLNALPLPLPRSYSYVYPYVPGPGPAHLSPA